MGIDELKGQIIKEIKVSKDHDKIIFYTQKGTTYLMYHRQDCCENVSIESIVGDLDDLLHTPVLLAEERAARSGNPISAPDLILHKSKHKDPYEEDESWTWTFYTIRTIKGTVDIRWYGSSNGYYSEEVEFEASK